MNPITKLIDNIYMTTIDLPNNPLKAINIFIIKGNEGEKSLILDTGFNQQSSKDAFEYIFEELNLNSDNTEIFLTHLHSDHTGLATYFFEKGMTIYASEVDSKLLNSSVLKEDPMWIRTVKHAKMQGLEQDNLDLEDHPGYKYRPSSYVDYTIAEIDHQIKVAGYNFQVIDIKGHTPGIIGLYDSDKKVLFCSDHILKKITPNITYWGSEFEDSLGHYFDSLEKVYKLEVDHLYSTHRDLIDNHRERIDEIRKHHKYRLDEALKAVENYGPCTVREVTKHMHWDISSKNWDDFPKSQKWFAAGEAHAHLEHLYALNQVSRTEIQGVLYYSIIK